MMDVNWSVSVAKGARDSGARALWIRSVDNRYALLGSAAAVLASVALGRSIGAGHGRTVFEIAVALPVFLFVVQRPRNGFYAGVALMIVMPYWLTFGSSAKSVFHIGVLLALASCMVVAAGSSLRRSRFHYVDASVVAFAAAALVSWALTDPTSRLLQATVNATLPLAFYAAARVIAPRLGLALVLLIGGAAASLTVFYEFAVTHEPLFSDPRKYLWNATSGTIFRPGGVLGSPPAAAAVLSMTTVIGFAVLHRQPRGRQLSIIALMLASTTAVILTFTRAGFLGLAVGALCCFVLSRPLPTTLVRLVLGGLVAVVLVSAVLPRLDADLTFRQGVLRTGTFGARISYWHEAWPLIVDSPEHLFFGHGFNSLVVATGEIPGRADPGLGRAPDLRAHGPHSQYVRTAFEEGLVGLGLLLTWLLGALRAGVLAARRAPSRRRYVIAAYVGAIGSLVVVAAAGDALRHPGTLAVIAVLSGSLVSYCQSLERRP
jgi:O-antigen ligase